MEYGNVQKGYIGISPPRMNSTYAIENGLNEIEGVYIDNVQEDSGAADAELREGDIIKKVDDIKVQRFVDLTGYISTKRPGDSVQLDIERDGEIMTVPIQLKKSQTITLPTMGLEVKDLNEKDQKRFKTKKGVKIVRVPPAYTDYGLKGKVIVEVDGNKVEDKEDAKRLFGRISRYGKTSITMLNDKGERERLIFQ